MYSSLSNKRAGWNKMCRLENWAKFGSFEILSLYWVDPNCFFGQIMLEITKIGILHANESQLKFKNE